MEVYPAALRRESPPRRAAAIQEDIMRAAVAYDEDEMIFQHFGHTERFKIYDIEDGEVVSTELADTGTPGTRPWPCSWPSAAWTPSSAEA